MAGWHNSAQTGFRCLQGLVDLRTNGREDGGLIVCKSGHLLSEDFHNMFENEPDEIWAWTHEYGACIR